MSSERGDYDITVSDSVVELPAKTLKVSRLTQNKPTRFDRLKRAVAWFSPETKLEASRLVLVLAAAVIGLVGVAQQKVDGLTLVQAIFAVCALGFGADTLKNLLTQR
jgi:hypothetical protein